MRQTGCNCGNRANRSFMRCRPECVLTERSIAFRTVDSATGYGIPGVIYDLRFYGTFAGTFISDSNGCTFLPRLAPGSYTFKQTYAAGIFNRNTDIFRIEVDNSGMALINGIPSGAFCVLNHRAGRAAHSILLTVIDAESLPVKGAAFKLYRYSNFICSAESNSNGLLAFNQLRQGFYRLISTASEQGVLPGKTFGLEVRQGGGVLIDGKPDGTIVI